MMIQPDELRLGNILQDKDGNFIVVHSIGVAAINESWTGPLEKGQYKHNPGINFNDGLRPVPLTTDWLTKLGFELHCGAFRRGDFCLEDGPYRPCDQFGLIHQPSVEVKHLHELQNLYFALIGQELTIPNMS